MAPAALLNLGVAMGERADQPAQWPGLGRVDPLPMRLVVVPDDDAFARISGGRVPDWGVGLALPAVRTLVVRADAADPMAALRHELAHLALHAAGEWDRFDALQLNLAVARGRVGDLRTLDASLRRGAGEAEAAYALAGAAVLHLARLHPDRTLDALVGRLSRGEDFSAAVLATTGLSLDRFDTAWRRDLRTRYGMVVWLVAGGGWAALGFVVIGVAIWRRRRDRPRRAALDVGWTIPEDEAEIAAESLDPERPSQ